MKKCILRGVAMAAFASFVLAVHAQDQTDQTQFPTILQQPVDACPPVGGSVTFSVQATNVDGYQWYRNNTAIDGETNNSLTLSNLGTNDVGYFFASVIKGAEAVPSRQACLNVYLIPTSTLVRSARVSSMGSFSSMGTMGALDLGGGGMIVVFGAPVVSSGGQPDTCPGHYAGYVNYTKTVSQGWGWAPSVGTTTHIASDENRSDTKIYYTGKRGDVNCNPYSITVPDPAPSPTYRFSIFFPTNVPTGSYPITLTGFDP